ncbi:DoxX family membrane protein [Woeseia oceani]|nr:DoxX family membrane protein [Woeseia oceani]
MKTFAVLFLRVSMGWLQVLWGIDKLVNVEHGVRVSEAFYMGLGANATIQTVFGGLQVLLGVLLIVGLFRRVAYPAQTLIAAATALGVWKSIIDPWGWFLEGTNVLFYPSLIVLAAALVLQSFKDDDVLSLDSRRTR